jgi:hypothetical protein
MKIRQALPPSMDWQVWMRASAHFTAAACGLVFEAPESEGQSVVSRHLLDGVGLKREEGHGGAVALIQRLGSAANLNIHLHFLVPTGARLWETRKPIQNLGRYDRSP